jgi:hypothetical protein
MDARAVSIDERSLDGLRPRLRSEDELSYQEGGQIVNGKVRLFLLPMDCLGSPTQRLVDGVVLMSGVRGPIVSRYSWNC